MKEKKRMRIAPNQSGSCKNSKEKADTASTEAKKNKKTVIGLMMKMITTNELEI